MKKRNPTITNLKEDLQQKWIQLSLRNQESYYHDQYGFKIYYGDTYRLTWHDRVITETYSLQAARQLSLILLNDLIACKPLELTNHLKKTA